MAYASQVLANAVTYPCGFFLAPSKQMGEMNAVKPKSTLTWVFYNSLTTQLHNSSPSMEPLPWHTVVGNSSPSIEPLPCHRQGVTSSPSTEPLPWNMRVKCWDNAIT